MSEEETTSTDIPTATRFPLSVETFEEDALGLEPFCRSLEDYLMVDHDFVGALKGSNAKYTDLTYVRDKKGVKRTL